MTYECGFKLRISDVLHYLTNKSNQSISIYPATFADVREYAEIVITTLCSVKPRLEFRQLLFETCAQGQIKTEMVVSVFFDEHTGIAIANPAVFFIDDYPVSINDEQMSLIHDYTSCRKFPVSAHAIIRGRTFTAQREGVGQAYPVMLLGFGLLGLLLGGSLSPASLPARFGFCFQLCPALGLLLRDSAG